MNATTHWDCGDFNFDVNGLIEKFVDDNVYNALKEYASDMHVHIASGDDPDELYVSLGEDRPNEEGFTDTIGKTFSLKEELLFWVHSVFADGAMHPEDCQKHLAKAEHLEGLAREIRERVKVAESVNHNYQWQRSSDSGDGDER